MVSTLFSKSTLLCVSTLFHVSTLSYLLGLLCESTLFCVSTLLYVSTLSCESTLFYMSTLFYVSTLFDVYTLLHIPVLFYVSTLFYAVCIVRDCSSVNSSQQIHELHHRDYYLVIFKKHNLWDESILEIHSLSVSTSSTAADACHVLLPASSTFAGNGESRAADGPLFV